MNAPSWESIEDSWGNNGLKYIKEINILLFDTKHLKILLNYLSGQNCSFYYCDIQ